MTRLGALATASILFGSAATAPAAAVPKGRFTFTAGDREPADTGAPDAAAIAELKDAVAKAPQDRAARFALVHGLLRANQLEAALAEAKAWRAIDAYNLVVVRLIGDIETAQGKTAEARRTYSAVVELLPKDAGAQRALASVLKQAGDLQGAYDRLTAAQKLAPDDRRLAFELADVAFRLGKTDEARERFEKIVGDPATSEQVRYPAAQRLAQIDHARARDAQAAGKADEAKALDAEIEALHIKGGAENDIKVYLTWDTDKSDVDLWVTNPAGERVFYQHKQGQFGEALFDDVTTGYGPESFTAPRAHAGQYLIQVNYYGAGRANFSEARGEVVVITDEGRPNEQRHVLPYRLFAVGQTVTVARVDVGHEGSE
jgi:tetratricopeptide (TPR) repeat protein